MPLAVQQQVIEMILIMTVRIQASNNNDERNTNGDRNNKIAFCCLEKAIY